VLLVRGARTAALRRTTCTFRTRGTHRT